MKLLMIIALLAMPSGFTYGYMAGGATLYSDPECQYAITTLPATYFVIVLEGESDICKVSYKDISGYARGIEIVDYEPVTKFASASFTVHNDGYPVKLRTGPDEKSPTVIEVPDGKSGYYYGDAQGSALIPQVGGTWRYVSYNDGVSSYNGYVYSSQVTVTDISPNIIEKVEYPEEDAPTTIQPAATDFVLIACLTVPSVLILYLVFRDKERKPRYKE